MFRLLKRERLQMLQRMHKQLALIHLSASLKGWHGYSTVYKVELLRCLIIILIQAKQAFLNGKFGSEKKKKVYEGTESVEDVPTGSALPDLVPARSFRLVFQRSF